jgi:urease accessory protein
VTVATAARPGRTAVQAHAAVRVEADAAGAARVVELRSAVPLVLRHTETRPAGREPTAARGGPGRGLADLAPPAVPTVTVHLVGAAAGPLAGDELRLDLRVGPGVRLVVRSVAATLAMPGHGPGPSTMEIDAEVAPGGALDVLTEPTVAVRGCRHRMAGRAVVAAGGWLRWREEVLLGRFREQPGTLETDLRVDVRGPGGLIRPLLRQQLPLGPGVPGLAGAAVAGSARAVGSLLIASPDREGGGVPGLGVAATVTPAAPAGRGHLPGGAAVLPLAGPGVLVTALAPDAVTLRRLLEP